MALNVSYVPEASLTITLNSVTDGSGATSSAVVDNVYPAMKIQVTIPAVTSADGTVDFYLMESIDGGTDYSTTVTTSDMTYIGSVNVDASSSTTKILNASNLPNDWKIYAVNNCGQTLSGSGNAVTYQYITYTDV